MILQSFSLSSVTDLPIAAQALLSFAGQHKIFLFYGEMGAGKTTFIKELCKKLGVHEPVTSPTFAIVNEYAGSQSAIYHFDFYRLKTQDEALDMGYEEYFYSGAYCFIEWPEKIPALLPDHYIQVELQVMPDQSRQLSFKSV